MHLVVEVDVQPQGETIAAAHHRVAGPRSHLEVGGSCGAAGGQRRTVDLPHQDAPGREAIPVVRLVEFLLDGSVGSQQELHGVGNPVELMILRNVFVQNAEGLDNR